MRKLRPTALGSPWGAGRKATCWDNCPRPTEDRRTAQWLASQRESESDPATVEIKVALIRMQRRVPGGLRTRRG